MQEICNKLTNKSATLGAVGLGYVGLPLAVEKAKADFTTIDFDVEKEKVDMVNECMPNYCVQRASKILNRDKKY